MEINFELAAACIYPESVEAHDCEFGLIGRVELNHCLAPGPICLDDRVHARVVLGELLEHESTEISWQVLNLDEVCWLLARRSS